MRKVSWIATVCLLSLLAASLAYGVGVRGRVVDSDEAPKSLVKVEFGAGGKTVATAWTDDYGNFGADVPPGRYQVTVSDGEEGGDSSVIGVSVEPGGKMSPSTLEVDW